MWWDLRPHQLSFPRFYLVLHVAVAVHAVVHVVVAVHVVVVVLARPALLVYSESPDLLRAAVVALQAPPRFTPCTMWWTRNSGSS